MPDKVLDLEIRITLTDKGEKEIFKQKLITLVKDHHERTHDKLFDFDVCPDPVCIKIRDAIEELLMTDTKQEKPKPFNGRLVGKISPALLLDYYMKGNNQDQKAAKIEILKQLINYQLTREARGGVTNIAEGELNKLKECKTEDEWNKICDEIKRNHNGYPSNWYVAVIAGELLASVKARILSSKLELE